MRWLCLLRLSREMRTVSNGTVVPVRFHLHMQHHRQHRVSKAAAAKVLPLLTTYAAYSACVRTSGRALTFLFGERR